MMNNLLMQGDVALKPVQTIKDGQKEKVENNVLAWGETSGHAHTITGDAEVFRIGNKVFVAVGSDGATLEHIKFKQKTKADHNPIQLQPNQNYEVLLQNEYRPFEGIFERVLD